MQEGLRAEPGRAFKQAGIESGGCYRTALGSGCKSGDIQQHINQTAAMPEVLGMKSPHDEGSTSPALVGLLDAILWANKLKHEADFHEGKISPESGETAVEKMIAGFRAMSELDFLD